MQIHELLVLTRDTDRQTSWGLQKTSAKLAEAKNTLNRVYKLGSLDGIGPWPPGFLGRLPNPLLPDTSLSPPLLSSLPPLFSAGRHSSSACSAASVLWEPLGLKQNIIYDINMMVCDKSWMVNRSLSGIGEPMIIIGRWAGSAYLQTMMWFAL